MADGRERAQWWHTASLLAQQYGLHRDPRRSPQRDVGFFHPYFRRRSRNGVRITAATITDLKVLLPQRDTPS